MMGRAGAPGRVGHIGEGLAGPTIIAFAPQDHIMRVAGAMAGASVDAGFGCETYVVEVAAQGPIAVDATK